MAVPPSALYRSIAKSVWVILALYNVLYLLIGANIVAIGLGVGTLILAPLGFWLDARGMTHAANRLLICAGNYYLFATSVGLNHQVNTEYFCFPALMLPWILFREVQKADMLLGVLLPVANWLMMRVFPVTLPSEWLPTLPSEVLKLLNFIGAASITLVFLSVFVRWISRLQKELVEAEREHHAQLDVERMKGIMNAKLASLGEMAASLAHEINNPLSVARGHFALFTRHQKETQTNQLQLIDKSLGKIETIINSLLKFSRPSTDRPFQRILVQDLFKEVQNLVYMKALRHKVNLTFDSDPKFAISGRSVELEQVFVNLINNAIDGVSTLHERWVRVRASQGATGLTISVVDSGKGIRSEIQEKMFTPFYSTKKDSGTGLGLAIARKIIEWHGGTLSYVPDSRNTTFEVHLKAESPDVNDLARSA